MGNIYHGFTFICLVWKYIVILSNRGTNCALLQTDSKECDAPIKLQSGF